MPLQDTFDSPTPDNLFAGTQVQPVVANEVLLQAGLGLLIRGTVLGKITADGEAVPVNSAVDPADGSEDVYAILAEDTDTGDTGGGDPIPAPGYFTGEFNENALTFGGTDTADTHRDAARALGIFFKENVPA